MIRRPCLAIALILVSALAPPIQAQSDREDNILILDDVAVANLGIETVEVMETEFVSTVFAIGRTEEIPSRRSSLSSRIAGRVKRIDVFEGDAVIKGQVLATIESRQPGNPPPSISLKAPADGLVIHSHIHLGEPVTPDSDLMEISDRRRLWAVAKIPERDVPALKPGKTRARIRIPALGDERIEATLVRFGVVADRLAGTLDGIFELPNEDLALQPGMRAEFSIITEVREWVTAVPREAIQGDPSNRFLFVKDFELPNAFLRVPVQLGEQNEESIEILRGLFPGDEVVTNGSYPLAFTGSGSGMSLKEALDAAHGHEHNEDGSDLTPEQLAARAEEERAAETTGSSGNPPTWIWAYSVAVTFLALIFFQLWWKSRTPGGTEA